MCQQLEKFLTDTAASIVLNVNLVCVRKLLRQEIPPRTVNISNSWW